VIMPCSDCVNYIVLSATKGECHLAPPLPTGEYSHFHSQWPIVLAADQCGQYLLGVHSGLRCSTCPNYVALGSDDLSSCSHTPPHELCADATCIAIPPTPTGEYRGEYSQWPRVLGSDFICNSCYSQLQP
jgi:hypothetical protein